MLRASYLTKSLSSNANRITGEPLNFVLRHTHSYNHLYMELHYIFFLADNVIRHEENVVLEGIFASLGRLSAESFRTNRLPLLNLPEDIKEALQKGSIEYTKARAIAKVKEDVKRAPLLQAAIKENLSLTEIQQRIRDIFAQEKADTTPSLKTQYKELSKQLGSSKVWDNPKKKKALEKLLNQIKVLLDEEQAITKT